MTLDQLSAAATEGECPCCGAPCEVTTTPARDFEWKDEYGNYQRTYHHATSIYSYRTGQLVAVADDVIERVARTLAPNLEGGREFDQMPKDRAQLRQWTAQGMCLINDATQDDATWLAQEAIKAAKGTGHE